MKKILSAIILVTALFLLAGCLANEVLVTTALPQAEPEYPHIHTANENIEQVAGSLDIERITVPPDEEPPDTPNRPLKIGVTHPHHDNVGQILRFFGAGLDFYELTHSDLRDARRLSEFYAIFINCGSHNNLDARVLRSYVEQGGIVYASDLAGGPLSLAFADMFEYEVVSPSLTVRNAEIVHTSLASHMRIDELDIVFNMGSWYVITSLYENAVTYIKGYVPRHGTVPLAMSFNYGEGTVFFTSFHNNAQVTSNMIDFIEYLIFRIKFIEADRSQAYAAEREGFEFRGQVFGFASAERTTARAMAEAGIMAAPSPGATTFALGADSAPSPQAASPPQSAYRESFQYTFSNGENFMLMVEAGGESFKLRLNDPLGNVFYISERGELISQSLISGSAPVFESIDGYGVLARNVTGGQWRFRIIAEDAADDAVFAIGIATQMQ